MKVIEGGFVRHEQRGYYALADLPQRPSVETIAKSVGWPEMDELWKIYPGQFTMVTGIAGHGKSTFLLNVICNVYADHGMKTFLFVPENESRLHEKLSNIWGSRQNWDSFANLGCFVQSAQPEHYDDEPKTLPWILHKAITAIEEDGVRLIMIDPFNELERSKPKDMLVTDYIGLVLQYLKGLCRKYEVAVILVAHPTKAGVQDGKVPGGADVEGSMNWFNKCDNFLTVHREGDKPVTRVISGKVREIGAGRRGTCYFDVDEHTGQFKPQYGAVSL